MWIILICIKKTLIEIKTSLENLWQRTIQLSDFFQYSMVLIPNRKCLVGGSRIRCGESGTRSIIIYTWWSIWHEGLECHAAMDDVFTWDIYCFALSLKTSQNGRGILRVLRLRQNCPDIAEDKSVSQPMMAYCTDAYVQHSAPVSQCWMCATV